MYRFLKFLAGIVLLPAAWGITAAFIEAAGAAGRWADLPLTTRWFAGGFGVWLILFFALPRPVKAYIAAHELTHALWGVMMGARVSKMRISGDGGSVTLSKSNIWITLAPYFFPFYSIAALLLYLLLTLRWDMAAYQPFWYAVFGLTWAFHLTFTISMIGGHQPDIREHGRVFSYALIYVMNLLVALILVALLAGIPLRELAVSAGDDIAAAYRTCFDWSAPRIRQAVEKSREFMQ